MNGTTKDTLAIWIATWLRTELSLGDAVLATDVSFARLGVDSVHAMMMVGDLEEYLDRRLSPTLPWDHATIDALATHLAAPVPATQAQAS